MKRLRKFISSNFHLTLPRLFKSLILGLVVGIAGVLISPFHFALTFEEDIGLGLLFKIRGHRKPPDDIVVVSIDKQSSDELGLHNNPDKWPRSLHARLVDNLVKEGARVIAFDVHFIEPRIKDDDVQFAQSIRNSQKVVLCEPLVPKELSTLGRGEAIASGHHNIVKIIKPLDLFADVAISTAPFVLPRIPFKVNRYWTFQAEAGDSPTLPVVTFQFANMHLFNDLVGRIRKFLPDKAEKLSSDSSTIVESGGIKQAIRDIEEIFREFPQLERQILAEMENEPVQSLDADDSRSLKRLVKMYGSPTSRYINYYGPPRTIRTIPYYKALQIHDGKYGNESLDFNDKVVFVGLSEILLAERKDSFYTVYSQADGVFISGVEIMASVYANIKNDTPVSPLSLKPFLILLLLWGLLLGVACQIFSSIRLSLLSITFLCISYLVVGVYLFKSRDLWIPMMVPVFLQAPIAFLGGVSIEHSMLFKEALGKLRIDKELSFARKIQMSMLPESCPEIKGYQIAASSTPAREVSGDFFDFIDIGEKQTGFVIADVTGKSVSGALVMTASKSVFRLLSEEELTVGEIMNRANRQIKKDITKETGMFVALLYAILNTEERSISMCSAGQTLPILLSAATGEAIMVETEGDAFPLGIIEDADYQETFLQLQSEDILIFYTDGVVEAMNKKKEMYGFNRFVDIIKKNRGLDVNLFLEIIIEDINSFVGKAEQHDDLTIVVIKVN